MMLRERDSRVTFGIQLLFSAAGTAVCAILCGILPAVILAGTAAAILTAEAFFLHYRGNRIAEMCEQISQVVNGAEKFTIPAYEEGELSILSTELQKLTLMLREQNRVMQEEKLLLKESLEDISHQIRTPLTSVILLLERMRRPTDDRAQYRDNIRELLSLTARMQWLIETLLGISRMEAGAVKFREETVQCREMLRAALEPIAVAIELKGIDVRTEISGEPVFVGDAAYCAEAVGNLLKNCMEHTPPGGTIRITVNQTSLYAGIVITDSGSGIAQEDLPHLFDRFYRGSEFAKNGYGIGLAFAKRVITGQNGSLQVRNAEPHGAVFDIRFYHLPDAEA